MTELNDQEIRELLTNPVDIIEVDSMRIVVTNEWEQVVDLAEPVDSGDLE